MVACEHCDAVHQRVHLHFGARAICLRCGSQLYRECTGAYKRLLPLLLSAFILFVLSNAFPIVSIDLKGVRSRARLIDAVLALQADHMVPLAILVFATTILIPIVEMLLMLHLLVPMRRGRRPRRFEFIVRCVSMTRPWGMTEVFMIGVLVTVVKLSAMAEVVPGIALWSFSALVIVLAALLSFDPRDLWQYLSEDLPGGQEPSP
jgi:paraquat-inducible protein A